MLLLLLLLLFVALVEEATNAVVVDDRLLAPSREERAPFPVPPRPNDDDHEIHKTCFCGSRATATCKKSLTLCAVNAETFVGDTNRYA